MLLQQPHLGWSLPIYLSSITSNYAAITTNPKLQRPAPLLAVAPLNAVANATLNVAICPDVYATWYGTYLAPTYGAALRRREVEWDETQETQFKPINKQQQKQ